MGIFRRKTKVAGAGVEAPPPAVWQLRFHVHLDPDAVEKGHDGQRAAVTEMMLTFATQDDLDAFHERAREEIPGYCSPEARELRLCPDVPAAMTAVLDGVQRAIAYHTAFGLPLVLEDGEAEPDGPTLQ